MIINEKNIEETIISLLQNKNYKLINKDDEWFLNRKLDEFINVNKLKGSLIKINNIKNDNIIQDVINKITRINSLSLFERNYKFHKMLVDGITIDSKEFKINPLIKIIDFDNVNNNTFEIVHQIEFNEGKRKRIPDVVIYINGIPLIVMELKTINEDNKNATLESAYEQLGSDSENDGYRYDIPTLFNYNTFLVISNGVCSKVGTITSKFNRFNEWKSVNGEKGYDDDYVDKINVLINGLFEKSRLLDVIKNNIFFINDKNQKLNKIMAQYHQYFGVKKALNSIIKIKKPDGNGKAGIIWHTQGSGKSFSMIMLAHRLLQDKSLNVPTIVVLTDRVDLDNQLYKTFFSAKEYLKCEPVFATSRIDLVKKINNKKQGGIIITTIGKFDKKNLPKNERNNIVVITDEAHRSHYGIYETTHYEFNKETNEMEAIFKYGIEKYIRDALPNATFIGFTGTPVSTKERQTTEVFGDIIDIYDMTQSIIDGSTVTLCYESRLAKARVDEEKLKQIDKYYNALEFLEKADKNSIDRSKAEMSKLKIILEDDDLINLFAIDILNHYEQRKGFLNGKAMIVCQTRIMALKLFNEIIRLNPQYKDTTILVVTESNKDTEKQRKIFGDSNYRHELGEEFKKDNSKYKIAIVCDMWLTGFDVPDLDVMYFIKKLKSHNLMQAIARVNRVYPGKKYGLIVDYFGFYEELNSALMTYTYRDKENNIQNIKNQIYKILKDKLNVLNSWFEKIDRSTFFDNDSSKRFKAIQEGAHFILQDKKNRENPFINDLSLAIKQSFFVTNSILKPEEKNDVMYYLAIRSFILKLRNENSIISTKDMNEYVEKILIDAIKGDEVKVLNEEKNIDSNIIDLLSKENIEKLRNKLLPNVFIEIMKKLLEKSIVESRKNNYLLSQEYSKKLIKILEQYNNRNIDFLPEITISGLVKFASDILSDEKEANKIGLNGRERAFYDALIKNSEVQELLNDETLKLIAIELKDVVDEYAKTTTDWTLKRNTRAKMRVKIKECLRKYNYPPEYQDVAINYVFVQAKHIID